ncbi:ELWxxDGT repeat protein [Archangium lipolyticum]|uniref:ELWxxDGT repeat protein n=1 Tax=Archangium lipolyticum TaxID=2970465 RepID=UPI002149CEDD|nr:ELWxxDGT repeat protein [Archangium lipolyticum]
MRIIRGAVGCLALGLAAMGCGDSGQAREERSARHEGRLSGETGSAPREFTWAGGKLFFTAEDSLHGRELWVSDGTGGGTRLVEDLVTGGHGYFPEKLTAANGVLFFVLGNGSYTDSTLWRSDGTAGGTWPLHSASTAPSRNFAVKEFVSAGGTLFLSARTESFGDFEVWKSDGTPEGTVLVKDILPWDNADIQLVDAVNGTLFFIANDGEGGRALWKSDGTAEGTVLLKRISEYLDSPLYDKAAVGGLLYFITNGSDSSTRALWKTDGTPEGTVHVTEVLSSPFSWSEDHFQLTAMGDALFFASYTGDPGIELWKSDGTAEGTGMLTDIYPSGWSEPQGLRAANGVLYFTAWSHETGREMWKSDGTAEGTVRITDFPGDSLGPQCFMVGVDARRAYFGVFNLGSSQVQLWRTDGTAEGTVLLRSFPLGGVDAGLQGSSAFRGDTFFFHADDGTGLQTWKTDGTPEGTVPLRDVTSGTTLR